MGLIDWFKKSPSNVTVENDVIWLNLQAKLNGISRRLADNLADRNPPAAVILVAHFPDCLEELERIAEKLNAPRSVTVVTAEALRNAGAPSFSVGDSQSILILVGERHPLLARDEGIAEFARSLPCRCALAHYLSLDDALLRKFVGESVRTMLKRLGMSEDEAIDSRMVSGQLRKTQQQIDRKRLGDFPAISAEAWLERNCPNV